LPALVIPASQLAMFIVVALHAHSFFYLPEWDCVRMKKPAAWLLETKPEWYNPDPQIFNMRASGSYDLQWTHEPIYYYAKDGRFMKALVWEDNTAALKLPGLSQQQVNALTQKLRYTLGYAYINRKDISN
jgi:hypothetical protein